MDKNNEIKKICESLIEKDTYENNNLNRIVDSLDKFVEEESDEDISQIKKIGTKLKEMGFSGPETNGDVIVKELIDAILSFF